LIKRLVESARGARPPQLEPRPPPAKHPCGLLFFDPPYRDPVAEDSLITADRNGWLAPDGLSVIQIHPKATFQTPTGFEIVEDRRYGATRFLFLERVS